LAIGAKHPNFGFSTHPTDKDLRAFIPWLKTSKLQQLTEDTEMYNSRVVHHDGKCSIDTEWTRLLPKGTWVWVDANTGEAFLKGNCGNVLGLLKKLAKCFDLLVDTRDERTTRHVEANLYRTGLTYDQLVGDANCPLTVTDDVTHKRVSTEKGCTTCTAESRQAVWPSDIKVGRKADAVFSFDCPSGQCTVRTSGELAIASYLWCFQTKDPYQGKPPAWDHESAYWIYTDLVDAATADDVATDVNAGKLKYHRVFIPALQLGQQ
jgi:hypothetical protein